MTGKRCGILTVIKDAGNNKKGQASWLCLCDCGEHTVVNGYDLRSGNTKSCGCRKNLSGSENNFYKHGGYKSKLYSKWKSIKLRCYNKNTENFKRYGGRGITICRIWKNDFKKFEKWAIKNNYKNGLTIDRIDSSMGYSPWNCQFITISENTKRSNKERARRKILNGL